MCIKCEMKKAIMGLAGMEEVEVKVATIGRGFIKEIGQLEEADDKLKAQIKEDMERLLEEAEKRITEEVEAKYSKKWADLNKLKKDVMLDALKMAGVTMTEEQLEGESMLLDKTTGEVSFLKLQPIDKEEAEV